MSFWDNFGKKIEETTQMATKKSTELVESTKLNASIRSEEQKIEKLYQEIGKQVYEDFCADETYGDFNEKCEQIRSSHAKISELEARILEIKNVQLCSNCNTEVSSSSAYCDQCGAKLSKD